MNRSRKSNDIVRGYKCSTISDKRINRFSSKQKGRSKRNELRYLYRFVSFTEEYTYDLSTLVHLRCDSFLLRYIEIFLEIVNSISRYNPIKYLNSVLSSRIRKIILPCNFHEIFVE